MKFPIKQMFWALIGGMISGFVAFKFGMPFWAASLIVLAGILLTDYLVHVWRFGKFTFALTRDFFEVHDWIEAHGGSVMAGTQQELMALFGVAYEIPHNPVIPWTHYCLADGKTERQLMAKYNLAHSHNPLYFIFEFLF